MATALSVIIPANNEAAHIGACLESVLASDDLTNGHAVQVIVVANGCQDETARIALSYAPQAAARLWQLDVLDLDEGSKPLALDQGEATALCSNFTYLDADVRLDASLLREVHDALQGPAPCYVTGRLRLARSKSWITRAYGAFYKQVPFLRQKAPGAGFFALNGAGRARWGAWPRIISDDTFARLNFAQSERIQVSAGYDWPLVEGFANLVKVRRRQNAGVDEISHKFPDLPANDSKPAFTAPRIVAAIVRAPIGFVVYSAVALTVKLTPGNTQDWRRGR